MLHDVSYGYVLLTAIALLQVSVIQKQKNKKKEHTSIKNIKTVVQSGTAVRQAEHDWHKTKIHQYPPFTDP